jgi:hypothetical protein
MIPGFELRVSWLLSRQLALHQPTVLFIQFSLYSNMNSETSLVSLWSVWTMYSSVLGDFFWKIKFFLQFFPYIFFLVFWNYCAI